MTENNQPSMFASKQLLKEGIHGKLHNLSVVRVRKEREHLVPKQHISTEHLRWYMCNIFGAEYLLLGGPF